MAGAEDRWHGVTRGGDYATEGMTVVQRVVFEEA